MDSTSIPPPAPLGDAALWTCVLHDDADAFGALFDRHHARVHRHALRWAESRQDAEDLVAAVFLEAWRRRDTVPIVDGSVLPWLLATANNLRRNAQRSGRRGHRAAERLRGVTATATPDHAEDVAERVDAQRRLRAVRRAFDRLDPVAQDVLTLCVLEGQSTASAAAVLCRPVGTVKSRLSRARAQLRRAVEDADGPAAVVALRPSHPSSPTAASSSDVPSERTAPCL